jgi:hypothetical protein
MEAVKKRDAEFVRYVLAPDIKLSFGGHRGVEDFETLWNPGDASSKLWNELSTILSLGGSFESRPGFTRFEAPYVSSRWPEKFSPHHYVAVTVDRLDVHEDAGDRYPVIGRLSYDIVQSSYSWQSIPTSWVSVVMPDGKRGYVLSRYVRSPIDLSATFEKRSGRWVLAALVSGD